MKILQVCPGAYVSGRGGVSEHVIRISEGLAKRGHDVTVFATNPRDLAWFEVINGVKVRRFKRVAPNGAYFFSPSMFWALTRAKGFDVVHAHNYHAFPFHAAAFAKRRLFIVSPSFHGAGHTSFRDCVIKVLKPIGKQTLNKADQILAASEFERFLICQKFGFKPREIVVIPRGINFSEFKNLERHKTRSRSVLFVGRLINYKGVQFLVEALPKLPDDVTLKIVGEGPLRSSLEDRAKQLGVLNRVRFYQNLKRRELLQLYVNSDVFVLLSRYEAYSKVIAEALTAGTPCIVANISALREWVDNESCFGIDYPISVEKLAELIGKIIEGNFNRDLAKKWMGTKIIDWSDVVSRLEEVYNK